MCIDWSDGDGLRDKNKGPGQNDANLNILPWLWLSFTWMIESRIL